VSCAAGFERARHPQGRSHACGRNDHPLERTRSQRTASSVSAPGADARAGSGHGGLAAAGGPRRASRSPSDRCVRDRHAVVGPRHDRHPWSAHRQGGPRRRGIGDHRSADRSDVPAARAADPARRRVLLAVEGHPLGSLVRGGLARGRDRRAGVHRREFHWRRRLLADVREHVPVLCDRTGARADPRVLARLCPRGVLHRAARAPARLGRRCDRDRRPRPPSAVAVRARGRFRRARQRRELARGPPHRCDRLGGRTRGRGAPASQGR